VPASMMWQNMGAREATSHRGREGHAMDALRDHEELGVACNILATSGLTVVTPDSSLES
jgi:hypothetical protein